MYICTPKYIKCTGKRANMSESPENPPQFFGFKDSGIKSAEIIILPVPYELTTSYGQGTVHGPKTTIAASHQVEVDDLDLEIDLSQTKFHTATSWESDEGTLQGQLLEMSKWFDRYLLEDGFPIIIGGEHGILPPLVGSLLKSAKSEGKLTIVQIDAHADLRDHLDGEPFSHACAARRALDAGASQLVQMGVRAWSLEESKFSKNDDRITTWTARSVLAPSTSFEMWQKWISSLKSIQGPIHLTIDIDGLDASVVPDTGPPVHGGLSFWHVVETIEALFSSKKGTVISADVCEIVPGQKNIITQFLAAQIVAKIASSQIFSKKTQDL